MWINDNNSGIDEDFIMNGGYANTTAYKIMIHRIKVKVLSNRQPYPQDHLQALPTCSHLHDRERHLIVGMSSYLEQHAFIRYESQKSQVND